MDIFDPIRHAGFDQLPLTRAERVNNVKKRGHFTKYGKQARNMLEALLDKYANKGIENMKDMKILQVNLLNQFGSTVEIVWPFGGKTQYQRALMELEREIYRAA
ncbi:MAG: type I restriction-modification enzyme R subunit C-terminal domain-containing protein [Arenicellales bacterium WSBS_2016_MAG_OTU3]